MVRQVQTQSHGLAKVLSTEGLFFGIQQRIQAIRVPLSEVEPLTSCPSGDSSAVRDRNVYPGLKFDALACFDHF